MRGKHLIRSICYNGSQTVCLAERISSSRPKDRRGLQRLAIAQQAHHSAGMEFPHASGLVAKSRRSSEHIWCSDGPGRSSAAVRLPLRPRPLGSARSVQPPPGVSAAARDRRPCAEYIYRGRKAVIVGGALKHPAYLYEDSRKIEISLFALFQLKYCGEKEKSKKGVSPISIELELTMLLYNLIPEPSLEA